MNFRPASAHPTGDIREVVVLLVSFGPMPSHSFPEDADGFSALSANWDAFCQYHFAPLLESAVDGNFAPLIQMLLLPFVAILVSMACWLFAVYIIAASTTAPVFRPNRPFPPRQADGRAGKRQ
jgi:hypothetical protein